MARLFVKTVRSKGSVYFYLVEPRIVGGRTIGQKVLRKLSQDEAQSYGWRRHLNDQNQTALPEEPTEPRSVKPTTASNSPEPESQAGTERCGTRRLETLQNESATGQTEVAKEPEKEEFKVVPRPRGFYALEPIGPHAPRGYVMVKTDGGTTRVFCGLCTGFTCSHVEFMRNWLRTHRGNSE